MNTKLLQIRGILFISLFIYLKLKFIKRRIKLKQISQQEKEWLIKNNILKMEMGKYPDLSITSKRKKHRKRYFVPDYMVNVLKDKLKISNK